MGRYGSKDPCVFECFLPCPRWGVPWTELSGDFAEAVNGEPALCVCVCGRSVRSGVGVGREKFCRLEVLVFAWADAAYKGRGGAGAFCSAGARCLATVKGPASSSGEEAILWTGRRGIVDVDAGIAGEKLPGARVGCPGVCDMARGLCNGPRAFA